MSDPSSPRSLRDGGAGTSASISKIIRNWLRNVGAARGGDTSLRKSLEVLIKEHAGADRADNPDERIMLMNILKLSELRVEDVMVPRADIVAVDVATPLDEVVTVFRTEFHSRMPVFRGTLDDVSGMVHVKDIVAMVGEHGGTSLDRIVREVLFAPASMTVLDLLTKMRQSHIHMAVVVDEYGGTDGLVTIEDLVEKIVGDIEDEHDRAEGPLVVARGEGMFDVAGRASIAEFEAEADVALTDRERDEDIDTVGGLVFTLVGRVPKPGERVAHASGVEFEVVDADARRVKRLRARIAPRRAAGSDT